MSGIEGLLAGHTLADRYRIDEVIGRGGFAAVYRARDERLQRTVAVKVVMVDAPDEESRERLRLRFHREAQVAASLQHASVVTIYDYGTDEKLGLDFLVMELLHGEDLAKRIFRLGPPPMELSLRILREAADGLAVGHHAGLVHRDVKPSNIFLEERTGTDVFRVCVLDFGIAQIVEGEDAVASVTRSRMPLSPAYAAPEQLRDERPLTPAADVYGLGMIGYELLTGARPFAGTSEESARRTIPALRDRNPEVPAALAAVIEKAISYAAADRYPDAGELLKALSLAQAAAVPPPPVVTAPEPVLPPSNVIAPPHLDDPVSPEIPPDEPTGEPRYRARRQPRLREEVATAVPSAASRRSALPAVIGASVLLLLLLAWWVMRRGNAPPTAVAPVAVRPDSRVVVARDSTPLAEAPVGAAPAPRPTRPAANAPVAGGLDPAARNARPGTAAARTVPTGPPGSRVPAPPPPRAAGGGAAAAHAEGLRLFDARRYSAAVAPLAEAAAKAPRDAAYRNDLGWALFLAGRPADAARELGEVIRLAPRREIAYANLAEVRLAQGDTAEAVRQYRRFLELNKDSRREAIARAKLERIQARRAR